MSHRHPIDDLFRRRLGNHHEPPPMQVWDRIEEKRRRNAVGASSGFGIFLAAAGIGLLLCFLQADVHQYFQPETVSKAATAVLTPPTSPVHRNRPSTTSPAAGHTEHRASNVPVREETAISANRLPQAEEMLTNNFENHPSPSDGAFAQELPSAMQWDAAPELSTMATAMLRQRSYPSPSQCASFRSAGWKLFAEWTGGLEGSFRSLNPREGTAADQNYADLRNQAELMLPGYSVQLRLAAVSRSGMVLRSGFHFAQIREQLRHIKETEERFTIINVLGPTGEVVGVDTVYETIFREDRLPVRYQMVSVPVLVGFEKRFGRWSAGVLGGALLNVNFNQRGSIVLPNADMPISITAAEEDGNNVFRPRLGVGWYAAANISWKLREKIQITAEPYLRAFPQSLTSASFPVQQKYVHSGIALGLRYEI